MKIKEAFKRENLIDILSMYESFYQISYGVLIHNFKISKDCVDATIELDIALASLYEMFLELDGLEEVDTIKEIRKQASIDALQKLINQNLELVKNKEIEVEEFVNAINDDTLYSKELFEIFENSITLQKEKWSEILTVELCKEIESSISQ